MVIVSESFFPEEKAVLFITLDSNDLERCRSGLSSWFRKPVCSLEYRGFESPPLRFFVFLPITLRITTCFGNIYKIAHKKTGRLILPVPLYSLYSWVGPHFCYSAASSFAELLSSFLSGFAGSGLPVRR